MFNRLLKPSLDESFFLFGARGTGKSTFLEELFQGENTEWIDLLLPKNQQDYLLNPEIFEQRLSTLDAKVQWIVIDEVQKAPILLDVVHSLIFKKRFKFALTGSSARKLKRGSANLLAGRALVYNLFPLTALEIGETFNLLDALNFGTLPNILNVKDIRTKRNYLRSYISTYMKEEVFSEQLVRKVDSFRLFLKVASQMSGKILNYANIAKDSGIDNETVKTYFSILEDTLLGFHLNPYHKSIRARQKQNPKFFLFDLGIKRALESQISQDINVESSNFGELFEHFIILETHRLNSYYELDYEFSYLRTKDDAEIDLIIERPGMPIALVEIKSSSRIIPDSVINKLARFKGDFKRGSFFVLCRENKPRVVNGINILPWEMGLYELGLQPT